jgi:hypothetical protein
MCPAGNGRGRPGPDRTRLAGRGPGLVNGLRRRPGGELREFHEMKVSVRSAPAACVRAPGAGPGAGRASRLRGRCIR